MLSDARVHATIPATDLERAQRFYAEKLGLTPSQETPGGLWYEGSAGTRFLLYPTQATASGTHTQLGFVVADIDAEVAELKARGAEFEEYDYPDLTTVGSIAQIGPTRAAWLKDSEGNLIGIVQLAE
jgi:predicted enzyme related to lactoylglutathione lyase